MRRRDPGTSVSWVRSPRSSRTRQRRSRSSPSTATCFIEQDRETPGGADVTVLVDDLDALVAEIASRGIEPDERATYSHGARKAIYRDADGNEIGFGGVPASAS
jgi:hypothetical protein